jgi:thioredoxin reductase
LGAEEREQKHVELDRETEYSDFNQHEHVIENLLSRERIKGTVNSVIIQISVSKKLTKVRLKDKKQITAETIMR